MIYNFYSDKTSGPIVNYISKWLPSVKLVDYKIVDMSNNIFGENAKEFTFGYDGGTCRLIISHDDIISFVHPFLSKNKSDVKFNIFYRTFVGSTSAKSTNYDEMKTYLIQTIRDYKISNILA